MSEDSVVAEKEDVDLSWEIRRALQIEKDIKIGSDAVKSITSACNYGSCKEVAQGMVQALQYEHRTLQQDFWRTIAMVAKEYANFQHDLRNKDAVEMAKNIAKMDGLARY